METTLSIRSILSSRQFWIAATLIIGFAAILSLLAKPVNMQQWREKKMAQQLHEQLSQEQENFTTHKTQMEEQSDKAFASLCKMLSIATTLCQYQDSAGCERSAQAREAFTIFANHSAADCGTPLALAPLH